MLFSLGLSIPSLGIDIPHPGIHVRRLGINFEEHNTCIGIVQAVLFIIGGKEVSLPSPINRAIQKKGEGCAG